MTGARESGALQPCLACLSVPVLRASAACVCAVTVAGRARAGGRPGARATDARVGRARRGGFARVNFQSMREDYTILE